MNVIDKINELDANSVTPEEFQEVWGITTEEYLSRMMVFIHERKAEASLENIEKRRVKKAEFEKMYDELIDAVEEASAQLDKKVSKTTQKEVNEWTQLTAKMLSKSCLDYTFNLDLVTHKADELKERIDIMRTTMGNVWIKYFNVKNALNPEMISGIIVPPFDEGSNILLTTKSRDEKDRNRIKEEVKSLTNPLLRSMYQKSENMDERNKIGSKEAEDVSGLIKLQIKGGATSMINTLKLMYIKEIRNEKNKFESKKDEGVKPLLDFIMENIRNKEEKNKIESKKEEEAMPRLGTIGTLLYLKSENMDQKNKIESKKEEKVTSVLETIGTLYLKSENMDQKNKIESKKGKEVTPMLETIRTLYLKSENMDKKNRFRNKQEEAATLLETIRSLYIKSEIWEEKGMFHNTKEEEIKPLLDFIMSTTDSKYRDEKNKVLSKKETKSMFETNMSIPTSPVKAKTCRNTRLS